MLIELRLQLRLVGYGYNLDLEARELSILWELNWCTGSEPIQTLGSAASLVACGPPDTAVDLYLDECVKISPNV